MAETDSIPGKSPAFQFYPNDFTSGTADLPAEDVGVYMRLLCYQWNKGAIPSDVTAQARIAGVSTAKMRTIWTRLKRHFTSGRNPRLEREREKQASFHRRQSDASRKRWDKPKPSHGNAVAYPTASIRDIPKPSSSSSVFSLQTSVKSVRASERDEIGERAGRFVNDTYPALYAKYRKGARYVSKPALDFQEAMELCRVWDDARLEKIAIVFLTTDHEFAEKGSRTLAQFRSMASWCDGKIAEAGIA